MSLRYCIPQVYGAFTSGLFMALVRTHEERRCANLGPIQSRISLSML